MSDKEIYEQKMKARLDEWQSVVDKYKARIKNAKADTKLELEQQINDLQAKQEKSKEKLLELSKSGEKTWKDIKSDLDRAIAELDGAIEAASSRFK